MRISGLLTCCGQLSLVAPKVEKHITLQTKQLVTKPQFCYTPLQVPRRGPCCLLGPQSSTLPLLCAASMCKLEVRQTSSEQQPMC